MTNTVLQKIDMDYKTFNWTQLQCTVSQILCINKYNSLIKRFENVQGTIA